MRKVIFFIIVATLLLIVGITGSILSFPGIPNKDLLLTEESFESETIHDLNIQTENATINILPSSDNKIKVALETGNKEDTLITDVKGNSLEVNIENKTWASISFNFFLPQTTLTVYLPKQQYKNLTIATDNGKIEIDALQAENVAIQSSNGKISLQNLLSNKINIHTNNGLIKLTDIEAGDTKFKSNNGKVTLTNVLGDITGDTSNGKITINTKNLDQQIDLHANNGIINIYTETLPSNNTLDLRTDLGKISVFDQSDWDTLIGNGEYLLKLRTNNGSIKIQQAQ